MFGELYHYPAGVHAKGTMRDIHEWDTGKYLGQIKEGLQTYNVIGNMNEYQVTIGQTKKKKTTVKKKKRSIARARQKKLLN